MPNLVDAWSYSRYGDYSQCPLKFKLKHIDKIDTGTSEAMLRGRRLHTAAEHYITAQRDDIAPELESRTDLLDALRGMFQEHGNVIVEQKWGFEAGWRVGSWFNKKGRKPVWLRATLDVGIDYRDASFEVIDWKTGKKYDENEEQMQLFATTVFARYPDVKEVKTRLSYVDLPAGEGSETYAEYDRGSFDSLKSDWEKRVEPMFNDDEFRPRPNRFCGWCPFSAGEGGQCKHG
jgi:putative RecB family exonuclease